MMWRQWKVWDGKNVLSVSSPEKYGEAEVPCIYILPVPVTVCFTYIYVGSTINVLIPPFIFIFHRFHCFLYFRCRRKLEAKCHYQGIVKVATMHRIMIILEQIFWRQNKKRKLWSTIFIFLSMHIRVWYDRKHKLNIWFLEIWIFNNNHSRIALNV